MRLPIRILTIAALVAVTCGSVLAQEPGAVLGRLVVEGRGKPVSGARVTLRNEESKNEVVLTTDRQGRFAHLGIRPGRYSALVERHGYAEVEVLEIDIRSSDRVRLNVEMTPFDDAPFRRKTIHFRRPMVDTESATIRTRVL